MNETRRRILSKLQDAPATGPDLADSLGVSRAAIWKQIDALRNAGVDIESGDDGYRLTGVSGYSAAAIEAGLEAPFTVEFHDRLESTNARARELAVDGAEDVVVVAAEQTGGRGRRDRPWTSPEGGVWMSVVSRPAIAPTRAPLFTLAAAVAVTRVSREAGVDAHIKWPNDVVVPRDDGGHEYAKLAGILTEMEGETDRISWLIVGMGINVDVERSALPEGATSLTLEGGSTDRRIVVQRVLETLHELRADLDAVIPAWRSHTITLGQRVRVEQPDTTIEGEAVDIRPNGALVVETDGSRQVVPAGDCEHLRPV